MTTTGLENFDRTLQKTHGWLNEIGEALDAEKQGDSTRSAPCSGRCATGC